jgi:hypothetical protein
MLDTDYFDNTKDKISDIDHINPSTLNKVDEYMQGIGLKSSKKLGLVISTEMSEEA